MKIAKVKIKNRNTLKFDDLVKSLKRRIPVIPAKAGIKLSPLTLPLSPAKGERAGVRGKNKKGNSYTIQLFQTLKNSLDSGFHRSDDFLRDR